MHKTCRWFILLLILIPVHPVSGEHIRADSLIALLDGDLHDTIRCRLLFEIAEEVKAADTALAISSLEEGRQIAENLHDTRRMGIYYKILGKVKSDCGYYEAAIINYDRALAYFNESEDRLNYYETIKEKGNAYLFLSDYSQAINHYSTALDFYQRNNIVIGVSRCLNNLGIIYKNQGDYVNALSMYEKSILYLDSSTYALDICQAYINMGNVFVYLGTYERGLEYYNRALKIAEREHDEKNISLCLSNAGVVQNKIGNYEEALDFYKRSMVVCQTLNDRVQFSNCLINIGTNYADMGDPEKGLEFVDRGMKIKEDLGDERVISNCNIHKAEIYTMMNAYDQGIELFNKAMQKKEQLGDQEGLIRCYLGLGNIYLHNRQYRTAESVTDKALHIASQIHTLEHMAEGFRIKREIAAARGNYRAAYDYALQHHRYQDSLMDQSISKIAMEMEFRHQSRELQQENENLRIQSNLNTALMRKRNVILYSILGLTFLMAAGLMLVVYFMRKLRHSSQKLEEQNMVITKQNLKLDHLNKTKDRIMSIIAHDLRGTIGNQLTAVEVLNRIEQAGENNPGRKSTFDRKKLLGNLKHSASYSLELLENLLHWTRLEERESHFHPEEVKLNNLVTSCIALFDETAENKGVTIHNEFAGNIACKVDQIMMEIIFRNLISNAVKFSNPGGKITIDAKQRDERTHCTITDEGIGMTPEQINTILHDGGFTRRGTANEKGAGMGLMLVREFTYLHGGELIITSEPGKGSRFEVIIPCRK